jgi:esterase/lipase superfamily enzyme/predicted acylesterase/phospholipase RssA
VNQSLNSSEASDVPRRIGLCLSGGGLRATFFHLGLVKFLRDANLLQNVTLICSVSGGSIFAAHLVLNWEKYVGTAEEYEQAEKEICDLGRRDIRGRIVRRWLLSWLFPPLKLLSQFRRTNLLQREYSTFYATGATLHDLKAPANRQRPELHLLATSFTTGRLYSFTNEGLWIERDNTPHLLQAGILPLSLAVAASSAFPPLFPPVMLRRKMLGAAMSELPYDPEYLSDGGVFDNLGFEKLVRLRADGRLNVDCLLLSDAGARFDWDTKRRLWWIVSRTVRSTDILMKRVADATLSSATEGLQSIRAVLLPISDVVPEDRFADALPKDVQRRLSFIRTDLDRFSDRQIDLLVRHGYEVAANKLGDLPEFQAPIKNASQASTLSKQTWDGKGVVLATRLLDRARRRSLGLFGRRDWASYAMILCAVMIGCLVYLPFGVQQYRIDQERAELRRITVDLKMRAAALASLSPGRITNIFLALLRERPRYFDDLVSDTLKLVAGEATLESMPDARILLASYIDGKYIGVITNGVDVGKIGILQEPPMTTYVIGFATNRRYEEGQVPSTRFGSARDVLTFGSTDIEVPFPRSSLTDAPRPLTPEQQQLFDKFAEVKDLSIISRDAFITGVKLEPTRRVLIFVHGYNVRFFDAIKAASRLSYELNVQSFPIAFSWPSEGTVLSYLHDEEAAQVSAPYLDEVVKVLGQKYSSRIDIIAQGLGAQVLLGAMKGLAKDAKLGQVIFLVPDIGTDVFTQNLRQVSNVADRITVYQNPNSALRLLRFLRGSPRAGEDTKGLPSIPGVDVVVNRESIALGSAPDRKTLNDLYSVLQGIPARDRVGLRRVKDVWDLK